jgi:hypothetical protein
MWLQGTCLPEWLVSDRSARRCYHPLLNGRLELTEHHSAAGYDAKELKGVFKISA